MVDKRGFPPDGLADGLSYNEVYNRLIRNQAASGVSIEQLSKKELDKMEEDWRQERANRPDYEMGLGTPWGNKANRGAARLQDLEQRAYRRMRRTHYDMGSRGASSGRYRFYGKWHTYGDEFSTVYQHRNIKFVKTNSGSSTAPMETMASGRVYVTVGKRNEIISITYYSGSGKRKKQIDLRHDHYADGKKERPHTHLGYQHEETGGTRAPNAKDKRMIDRVEKLWYNYVSTHS